MFERVEHVKIGLLSRAFGREAEGAGGVLSISGKYQRFCEYGPHAKGRLGVFAEVAQGRSQRLVEPAWWAGPFVCPNNPFRAVSADYS